MSATVSSKPQNHIQTTKGSMIKTQQKPPSLNTNMQNDPYLRMNHRVIFDSGSHSILSIFLPVCESLNPGWPQHALYGIITHLKENVWLYQHTNSWTHEWGHDPLLQYCIIRHWVCSRNDLQTLDTVTLQKTWCKAEQKKKERKPNHYQLICVNKHVHMTGVVQTIQKFSSVQRERKWESHGRQVWRCFFIFVSALCMQVSYEVWLFLFCK